jgi:hypothetical protein
VSDEDKTQELPIVFVKQDEPMEENPIDIWVREQLDAEHKIIEETVEKAIQSGEHGVMLVRSRLGMLVSCEVSPEVPYGRMHIFEEG